MKQIKIKQDATPFCNLRIDIDGTIVEEVRAVKIWKSGIGALQMEITLDLDNGAGVAIETTPRNFTE